MPSSRLSTMSNLSDDLIPEHLRDDRHADPGGADGMDATDEVADELPPRKTQPISPNLLRD